MTHEPLDLVFFDGDCGFCHRQVHFLVMRDRQGAFRFAPLGGVTFLQALTDHERRRLPDSVVVKTDAGKVLTRSDAAVHLLRRIGGWWGVGGALLRVVPRPLRDWGYGVVARRRRKLAAKPDAACPMVPVELRDRFLA